MKLKGKQLGLKSKLLFGYKMLRRSCANGMRFLNKSGCIYLENRQGTFPILSLLSQQPSTVLCHLNRVIHGDQDGCATSFYCLSVGGPANIEGIFIVRVIKHFIPVFYFFLFHFLLKKLQFQQPCSIEYNQLSKKLYKM